METEKLKILAANSAMADMIRKGWLDICTINTVADMLGTMPDAEAHKILHSQHCIHFNKMPRELYEAMTTLIPLAVGEPTMVITFKEPDLNTITEEGTKKGWLGFGKKGGS